MTLPIGCYAGPNVLACSRPRNSRVLELRHTAACSDKSASATVDGVDQVNDVWIGDSGATTHMTRNADVMYDTRPPSPHRSRVILGDGSIGKVQFVGKLGLVFHSRTDHSVTIHDVYFVPDLGFNLFSFQVVQEKHEIILNKTGAHLLNRRLVFPHRSNESSLRATRVMPGVHASASNALATFAPPFPCTVP